MSEQIFISYRRQGGDFAANTLYEQLTARGYSVFYDVKTLGPGRYDEILLQRIRDCEQFISVLTPGCLTRCEEEDDWVRREIREAISCGKKIIPVITRGFDWPGDIPSDIEILSRTNGVSFQDLSTLNASVDILVDFLEDRTPEKKTPAQLRRNGPSMISFVNSFGSNDDTNGWVRQCPYTDRVNTDQFGVIYFHVRLRSIVTKPRDSRVGISIYNDSDSLIYEHSTDIAFSPGHDRFCMGWIIKGVDGSSVQPGKYRAEFWIDTSRIHEYTFWIMDQYHPAPDAVIDPLIRPENRLLKKKIRELENKLSRPRGYLFHLLMMVGILFMHLDGSEPIAIAGMVVFFLFCILLVQYTKHHVWNNWVGAVALSLVGSYFYGAYLLVGAVNCLFFRRRWKTELAQLRHYAREQLALDPDVDP